MTRLAHYRRSRSSGTSTGAGKGIWVGTVEAPDKQGAIEKAAQEFNVDAWRLYAVQRL
jgi:hypothetical protein